MREMEALLKKTGAQEGGHQLTSTKVHIQLKRKSTKAIVCETKVMSEGTERSQGQLGRLANPSMVYIRNRAQNECNNTGVDGRELSRK